MGVDVAIRGVSGVLARAAADRTGVAGLGVTAGACALVALIAWLPLALAFAAATGAIPAGLLLVPVALAVVLVVERRPTSATLQAFARRVPDAPYLVAPVFATVLFVFTWAGTHRGSEGQIGVVPQILFPAVVGASSYALIRWNAELQRALRPLLDRRDRQRMVARITVAVVAPLVLSLLLGRLLSIALAQQIVVLAGLALSYTMFAPRLEHAAP